MNQMKKAIEIVGRENIAAFFGVSPQAVSLWASSQVPAERCPGIEYLAAGAVRCEGLRSDIDWSVLRNSDCKDADAAREPRVSPPAAAHGGI